MKQKLTRLAQTLIGVVPALALFLAVQSSTSTCFFCLYQPDVPEGLER
ncbi:MAG: cyclic lactone autoinducer peptide [Peptococcaceae bacterium]|jgi:cyclic lactone autoinducer peptide|nr:cyclic lactone autoinducer peptide [Peptococcaceae bacterium]